MKAVIGSDDVRGALADPAARAALRTRLSSHGSFGRPSPVIDPAAVSPSSALPRSADAKPGAGSAPHALAEPSPQAQAEQWEHDRYFGVERPAGQAAESFVAGLLLAHLAVQANCEEMGVTLLDELEWDLLSAACRR